ncbi:MAG: hypothetical protein ACLU3U_09240 [Gallintestinimicrobium sp.]
MTADLYYETARKLVLKDEREVFVRQLNAGDAEAMLVYLQKTAQETHFLMRLPEEAVYTPGERAENSAEYERIKADIYAGSTDSGWKCCWKCGYISHRGTV